MSTKGKPFWQFINQPIVILVLTGIALTYLPFSWNRVKENRSDAFEYYRTCKELEYRFRVVAPLTAGKFNNSLVNRDETATNKKFEDFLVLTNGTQPLFYEFQNESLPALLVRTVYLNPEPNSMGKIDQAIELAIALQEFVRNELHSTPKRLSPEAFIKNLSETATKIESLLLETEVIVPIAPPSL